MSEPIINRLAACRHCGTFVSFGSDGAYPACHTDSRVDPGPEAAARIAAERKEDAKRAVWQAEQEHNVNAGGKAEQRRVGAALILVGVLLTGMTNVWAPPGQGGFIFYGMVVAGFVQLARGMS